MNKKNEQMDKQISNCGRKEVDKDLSNPPKKCFKSAVALTNEWTNKWMNKRMDKAMGEGYLCNSRIYVSKVLHHQLVNKRTNNQMNERKYKRMSVCAM